MPKKIKKKKIDFYFGKPQEDLFKEYLTLPAGKAKDAFYTKQIHPVLQRLVQNIVNYDRFNFKKMGTEKDLIDETMGQMYIILEKFNPLKRSKVTGKRVKAYSYFGTCAKNYLAQKMIRRGTGFPRTDYLDDLGFHGKDDFIALQIPNEEELQLDKMVKEEAEQLSKLEICKAIDDKLENEVNQLELQRAFLLKTKEYAMKFDFSDMSREHFKNFIKDSFPELSTQKRNNLRRYVKQVLQGVYIKRYGLRYVAGRGGQNKIAKTKKVL